MKGFFATIGAVALALSVLASGVSAQGTTAPAKSDQKTESKASATTTAPAKSATPATPAKAADHGEKKGAKVDLNTASAADLKGAGFSDAEAQKIIDGRPWKRKDELVKKNILSEESYKKLKDGIIAHQMKAEKKK